MLKKLKKIFNKKEARLRKLELEVTELRLKELKREIEQSENKSSNTTIKDLLERNSFNKEL